MFLFIEEDRRRFQVLKNILNCRQDPPNIEVKARCGTFEEHIGEAFGNIQIFEDDCLPTIPSFVMVDPFGIKGIPLSLLEKLAAFPKVELLISFMYEPIARFLSSLEFKPHLDALFGTEEWREAMGLTSDDKKQFLSNLYAHQLMKIGMEYVRLFEMRDAGNRTEYFLAFATHHVEGLRVIKDAMWKADEVGGVIFSDFTDPSPDQGVLFEPEPNYIQLRKLLMTHFAGCIDVPVIKINNYVLTKTAFRETHGRDVLRQAERSNAITVTRPSGRRKNYWNIGTSITFPQSE